VRTALPAVALYDAHSLFAAVLSCELLLWLLLLPLALEFAHM
jgi:hypothetical protein